MGRRAEARNLGRLGRPDVESGSAAAYTRRMFTGFAHVAVCVTDIEEATRWYSDVLGLRVLSPPYEMAGPEIEQDMGELIPVTGRREGSDCGARCRRPCDRVLAMRPTFNPNDFRHANSSLLRDHAVSDVYEPGSTFKLVAYSAALEEHVTTPDAMIDTQGGQINVAGRIVHDDRDADQLREPLS